ncbi:MAG: alpha/beta hydrolase [Clostridiaceae bacterium]|nr:alpha/beta hydrolase [Clostridiaceae bacterium]
MTGYSIKTIKNNPTLEGMAALVPDVVFSNAAGAELKMQIIRPWKDENSALPKQKSPLIVFLQGSAWTFPNVYYQIPQLSEFARMGYVVATITHRNFNDGYPAPAFLQDAKTAIRYLRKNAEEYGIDTERVCFWGTSSGGNTSLLVALTGDDPKYKTDEYAEYSDSVSVAIDCFGPTDLVRLSKLAEATGNSSLLEGLVGGKLSEHMELLEEISPLRIIRKNKKYPPILILHGDADELVPYDESLNMYKALIDNGNEAEMIRVENAPHEHSFWSRELLAEIADFIKRKL